MYWPSGLKEIPNQEAMQHFFVIIVQGLRTLDKVQHVGASHRKQHQHRLLKI